MAEKFVEFKVVGRCPKHGSCTFSKYSYYTLLYNCASDSSALIKINVPESK
jgi:hypothetical protein